MASIQIVLGLLLLSFYHPFFIVWGVIQILIIWWVLRNTSKPGLTTSWTESKYKYSVASWFGEMARTLKSIKFSEPDLAINKTDLQVMGYLGARTKHFNVLLFQYKILVFFKVCMTLAMLTIGAVLLVNQQLNVGEFIAVEIVIIMVINAVEKMIISLESGLWHGASWTFVAWGALHGLLLLGERFFKPLISVDKVGTVLRHLLVIKTFVLTSLIWIFFRAENFEKAEAVFRALRAFNTGLFNSTTYYLAAGSASLLLLGDIWLKGARMDQKLSAQPLVIRWTLYTVLIFGLLAFAGTEKFAFIYFQF